jgi:hypothetical protein
MLTIESVLTAITVVIVIVEVATAIWGVREHLIACMALKEDCNADRATVQEAGGRVSTISSDASSLFQSIADALNWKEEEPKR